MEYEERNHKKEFNKYKQIIIWFLQLIFYFVFTKSLTHQKRIEKDNMMEGIIIRNSKKKWMKNFIFNKVTNFYFYVQFLFWFFNLKF